MSDNIVNYKPNKSDNEMQYKIVQSYTITGLEEVVSDYIKEGWTPFGGISTTVLTDTPLGGIIHYYQVMIKNFSMSMKLPCEDK